MIGMLKVKGYKLQANKLTFFFGASELNGMSINPFKTDSSTAKCRSDPNLSTLHALVLNSGIAFNCSLSFYLVVFMNVNSKTTDDTTYHVVEFIADPFATTSLNTSTTTSPTTIADNVIDNIDDKVIYDIADNG